jgi:quinol monooxygenase YgiN
MQTGTPGCADTPEEARIYGDHSTTRGRGMYARSTTVQGDPATLDEAIAYVGEKEFPAITGIPGCVGLSMLADRDTGRVIVSSAWADEEALKESKETVRPMQDRLMQMLRADDALIQPWDIAVLHREHPSKDGSRAAVTWTRVAPDHMDTLLNAYRGSMLARLQTLPGFCSLSLVVDRKQGRAVSVTSFESNEALQLTRKEARSMREEFARAVGARIVDVAEMDVVVAHLHVPSTD